MPLYIKDDRVASMARDLAGRRGCTVTELVRQALEKVAEDVRREDEAWEEELRAIQERARKNWTGPMTSNHDFMYDKDGNSIL